MDPEEAEDVNLSIQTYTRIVPSDVSVVKGPDDVRGWEGSLTGNQVGGLMDGGGLMNG